MSCLRRASFALVVTGVAAACTLIDPLDDISGGPPKATSEKKDGASSSSGGTSSGSTSGNDATTGTSSSSGAPGFACSGEKEQEPNDTAGQATALSAAGHFCGTLTGGAADVDRWRFTNTTGQNLQIVVRIDAQSDLNESLQSGSSQVNGPAGGSTVSHLASGDTLALTLTAPTDATQDIGYEIVFAAN